MGGCGGGSGVAIPKKSEKSLPGPRPVGLKKSGKSLEKGRKVWKKS